MGECGAVLSKLICAVVGGSRHPMFSMKSSLTHPQEAVGRARRLPVPAGVCRACYNISQNNAQGVGHDYRNVNCTFTSEHSCASQGLRETPCLD